MTAEKIAEGRPDLLTRMAGEEVFASCDDDERTKRRTLLTAYLGVSAITPSWGVVYILFGEVVAGLIPAVYGVLTFVSVFALRYVGGWEWLRRAQLVQHLMLPFLLMWTLGGFGPSSAVLIWALLAPLSSLWASRRNEALIVAGAFIALTFITGVVDGMLPDQTGIPDWAIIAFYVGNFAVMTCVIFLLLAYFVREQEQSVAVLRRNRELESAYLEQEVSLRQSEKLATIGKLSAGLAHELNNPAAAVQQATSDLSSMLLGDQQLRSDVDRLGLGDDEAAALWSFAERIRDRVQHPEFIDPLDRSDREADTQDFLDDRGIDNSWEIAPALVSLGLHPSDVATLSDSIAPERFGAALDLLARQFHRQSLVGSLDESTTRIIAMVRALKSYTHLDQAPSQLVDVHEGLESTLVMFQNRLKGGVEVRRTYADDVPMIDAYAGELNQVWTNLIDNALDAMNGSGVLAIRTLRHGDDVVIELTDDGPGVPPELLDTIFDPFVTSKAPGEGTGLGLNISHSIITQKHQGQIRVWSEPGRTTFSVQLPIRAAGRVSTAAEED